jgi:hypothetical protein
METKELSTQKTVRLASPLELLKLSLLGIVRANQVDYAQFQQRVLGRTPQALWADAPDHSAGYFQHGLATHRIA